jgi:predicted Zn-dependent peptidase
VFHSELAKLTRTGIPRQDLKRIQDSLIYSFELSTENAESRMMTISTSELFFKRDISSREYAKGVRAIKTIDTQALAKLWVQGGHPSILVLSAKPKGRAEWERVKEFSSRITGTDLELEAF